MAVLMTRQAKGAAQRTLHRAVDVALAILLLVQMCYQLLSEDLHALLGVVMTVVAAVHLWFNIPWVRSLGKGRWDAARLLLAACSATSLLLTALLALSGLVLSGILPALRPLDHTLGERKGAVGLRLHGPTAAEPGYASRDYASFFESALASCVLSTMPP